LNGKAISPLITGVTPNSTVLFGASTDECTTFRAKNGDELRADMEASVTSKPAREFASRVKDPTALKAAVEVSYVENLRGLDITFADWRRNIRPTQRFVYRVNAGGCVSQPSTRALTGFRVNDPDRKGS